MKTLGFGDVQTPASAANVIRVLLVEDNPGEARLMGEMLATAAPYFEVRHVDRLAGALQTLASEKVDVVLLDLTLPDSHGLETFFQVHERAPTVPVVVMTGLDDEEMAIRAVQGGSQDYLVKGQVTVSLLARALRYAIERQHLLHELQEALARIKTLRGLLPICASCKMIRDDKGYWNHLETYFKEHSDLDFTHGICPDCARKLYPDIYPGPEKATGEQGH